MKVKEAPIQRIVRPFERFAHLESSGGVLLFVCTVLALAWANSAWSGGYSALWSSRVSVGFGTWELSKPLLLWINDGLMAIFFFVVGLEIKREFLIGELADRKKAALPIFGAIGGMVVPAGLYAAVAWGDEAAMRGWAIPMATDIAFALGALAILGDRVTKSLKVFLVALAIVDDIGAILVIAVFYTEEISWSMLGVGFIFLAIMALGNKLGVRTPYFYGILGLGLWLAFLKSGVHATIAGVLGAFTIPASTVISPRQFLEKVRRAIDRFDEASRGKSGPMYATEEQQSTVASVEHACERLEAPMMRLEHRLHPYVMFLIMPIFALANAGVALGGESSFSLSDACPLGIVLGLVIGKPLGIFLTSWLAGKAGLANLEGFRLMHIVGAGCLGGIGFTMSLFIAALGFGDSDLLAPAKIAILLASVVSGILGMVILSRGSSKVRE